MAKSMRALHWAESKHPRDDRGRFAHKGGGKWMARVAKDLQGRFGDISMGAHPDHTPQGRLQSTGRPGHVLDIGAVRRTAQAAKAASTTQHAGDTTARTGRTPTGTFVHGTKSATSSNAGVMPRAGELKPGDFATVRGTDQYGRVTKLTGHVQAASPVRIRKKGAKTGVERIAVQMSENPGGANGWRGTVYAHPSLAVEDHTPAAAKPGSSSPTTRKPSEVARDVAAESPAALAHQTPGGGEARRGRTPSGVLGGAPDASTNTSRRDEIAKAEASAGTRTGRSPVGVATGSEDPLDGMTVVKSSGGNWAVRGNEADRKATSAYLYMSKSKADAEDWAHTHAAARRAMRAGNHEEAARLSRERTAALAGGEGRLYRPEGSVAMVPAAVAKERAAAFRAGRTPAGKVDTPRVTGDTGGMTATDEAGITDPVDLARIRSAIAEHGGGYYGGPLGLSKGDTARYLSEGHLKELAAKHGYDAVHAAVAAEIARNPGALDLKPGSPEHKAMVAARLEASKAASKRALEAVKAGNIDEAQRIIDDAEQADPNYREGGFSWSDMRGYVEKQRGAAPKAAEPAPAPAPTPGRTPSGLEKAVAERREMRVDELNAATDPKANGAKIKALQNGRIDVADLYRKTEAGPSGQRRDTHVGRVRHTPDSRFEYTITDKNGAKVGGADTTVRNGETKYALYSEDDNGGQQLVGWSDSLAVGADVLVNGQHAATGRHDSRRISSGGFEPHVQKPIEQLDREAAQREADNERISAERAAARAAGQPELAVNRRADETARIENARANVGNGPASTKTPLGRRPDGSYKYGDYSKANYDIGNLTVAEAGIPDQGAVHSQYQQILKGIDTIKRQGPARVGSKDQYYRPMTRKLEQAAQYVNEHEGDQEVVAKLRALADIFRPQGDKAPDLKSAADVRAERDAMTAAREALSKPTRTNTGEAASNAHGGNTPGGAAVPGRDFSMRELKSILAGERGYAPAIRSTDEHRRILEEAGATRQQSEAIMKKLGADTESGHLTADLTMALHFGAMTEARNEADATRAAKLLEATPKAYAGLLGDGPGAVTHPQSRKVIEAMQANGWVLKDAQAGGISTWGPPGDDSKSMVMISGKDRPTFMDSNRKLSGVKAIAHVGGEEQSPVAAPKTAALDRKIASAQKKVETLQGRVGMAYDRRTSKGARIQSRNESNARAQLETARQELRTLELERDTNAKRASGGLVGATMAEVDAAMRDTPGSHRDNEAAWKEGIRQKLGLPGDNGEPHFKRDQIEVTGDQLKVGDFISDGASGGLGFQVAGIERNENGTLSVYGPGMMSRTHRRVAPNESIQAWRPGVSDANLAPLRPEEADLNLMQRRTLEGYGAPGSPERLEVANRLREGNRRRAADEGGVQTPTVVAAATGQETREPERPTGSREGVSSDVLERSLTKLRANLEANRRDGGPNQEGRVLAVQNQIDALERQLAERRGDTAAQLRGEAGLPDALARATAPPARVRGVRQSVSVTDAAEILQSANTRADGQRALDGMSVEELRDVARHLNVRRDNANKQELKDRIVERTVGSRLNASAVRQDEPPARVGRTPAGTRATTGGGAGSGYAHLTDAQIRNGLEMRGTSDPALVAEAARRGIEWREPERPGKAEAGATPAPRAGRTPSGIRAAEVTIWNKDTRRPERTEQRAVKITGLDQAGSPGEQTIIEQAIDDGLSAYRAEYRPPTFAVTSTDVESLGAHYDQFGFRIGTDTVRVHPSHATYRAEKLPHTIRHEIAHRAELVLESKVEARSGKDAAEQWKRRVDQEVIAWRDRAQREAPDDPRLKYATLTQHFRDTGHAHAVGDPANEAFADLVGRLAGGETMPGDPSKVLALIREADPDGLFAKEISAPRAGRTPSGLDTTRVSRDTGPMTATAKDYTVGQRVEVRTNNFDKPGMPLEWFPGKITRSEPIGDAGRSDLMIELDNGKRIPQIVGKRGGGTNVRPLDEAANTGPIVPTSGNTASGRTVDTLKWRSTRLSQLDKGAVIVRTEQRNDYIVGVVDHVEFTSRGAIVHYQDGSTARKARSATVAVASNVPEADLAAFRAKTDITPSVSPDIFHRPTTVPPGVKVSANPLLEERAKKAARVDEQEADFLRGLNEPFLASTVSESRFRRLLDSGQIRPTGKTYRSEPLYEATPTAKVGPVPKVTGYVKGSEVRPGMLINAADLLPMHESQGNTTGENPNPRGHQAWIRVGLIGNTNNPAYQSYNSNRSLTGGMYVIFDQSGHPAGRMSANTIAEANTEDVRPEAALQQLRTPVKVQVQVKNPRTKEVTIEERDGFDMALVPSRFAQEQAGMPAPKMLSEGIVDPTDPNYGPRGRRPQPQHRPHGERIQGTRTPAEAAADRTKRREVYASGEEERARRRAEEKARQQAEAAAQREVDRIEAEKRYAEQRERDRRAAITRRHASILEDLADTNPMIYDRSIGTTRSATVEEFAADQLSRFTSDTTWLAQAYGIKTRGVDRRELPAQIVAAVKAGKTPDLEVGAPKVLDESQAAAAEAKKIATADKRRRTAILKNMQETRDDIAREFFANRSGIPFHLAYLSDTQTEQLAAALGIFGLTGKAQMEAIVEAIKAGAEPNLDVNPITSLKKSRR